MKITIIDKEVDVDIYSAWKIIKQILSKPNSIIGLSTGNTTIGIHATVAEIFGKYHFPTSELMVYGVDELIMIPPTSEVTCGNRIYSQFIKPLNIPRGNLIMPRNISDDYDLESSAFESKLAANGPIDLQILGLGPDGHLGFNLPGSPFESVTRVVPVSGEVQERISKQLNLAPGQEIKGITLGLRTIMNVNKIVLVAKGKHKASIVKQALLGSISTNVPASVLQLHPDCEFVLDAEAASELLK